MKNSKGFLRKPEKKKSDLPQFAVSGEEPCWHDHGEYCGTGFLPKGGSIPAEFIHNESAGGCGT